MGDTALSSCSSTATAVSVPATVQTPVRAAPVRALWSRRAGLFLLLPDLGDPCALHAAARLSIHKPQQPPKKWDFRASPCCRPFPLSLSCSTLNSRLPKPCNCLLVSTPYPALLLLSAHPTYPKLILLQLRLTAPSQHLGTAMQHPTQHPTHPQSDSRHTQLPTPPLLP